MEHFTTTLTYINALMVLANLAVLGLNLKLYTEVFKEQAMRKRAKGAADGEQRAS